MYIYLYNFKGPAVMKGYFNNEKANETTFTEVKISLHLQSFQR